jgi:four helix bundle protein
MDEKSRVYDLEERLIAFAIRMLEVSELLPKTNAGIHLSDQLVRSGTSPAFNYGEAQAAESSRDFIHKIGIVLKELRETSICLKIIIRKPLVKETDTIKKDLSEWSELIAIFAKSVKTAKGIRKGNV